ncbi:copper amine oxidase N-terminal domain-containing protein [Fenollaria sporofastidiosus]|uniref:copper amine oxidase N-terminal domain-containing protein n=1 Tax=Fenollaria sporofastidiosus TaxID=2811778 RepID=UPI001C0025F7|nr:stalk domain-containing protein [Fenollaria sporofastidiosus]
MKKIRNILSIALVFVMLIGFAPVNVFAGETGTQTPAQTNTGTPQQPPAVDPVAKAKEEAKTKVDSLTYLSTEDKNRALGTIRDAQTVDEAKNAASEAETKDKKAETTAKEAAKTKVSNDPYLSAEEKRVATAAIEGAQDKAVLDRVVADTNRLSANNRDAATRKNIIIKDSSFGYAEVNVNPAVVGQTVTVKAYPNSGYVVDSIVVTDASGHVLDLRNFEYKNYYNEYPYWYGRYGYKYSYRYNFYDYRRWCYDTNSTVRSFSNYKYWCRLNNYTVDEDDYDDFIYWYDRYDDDDYYNWRYDRSYTYYDKADFTMPESNVTVTVTFTSAPYWRDGYYYDSRTGTYRRYYDDDDYYYYRYRRNKKSNYYERQAKADEEENDKAEEEKKAPVLKSESRAVITIGSTILNKADMSGQSIMAMDVAAYVKDGRTMLPIRYVAEALGLQVSWVKETRTVLIWDGINRIEIPVDTNKMIVNSVPYINDVKPEMKNGRTMLAVANIARMLGLQDGQDITWDAGKQQVTFVRKIYSK